MCECLEHDDRTITLCEVCADVWRETETERCSALSRRVPGGEGGGERLPGWFPLVIRILKYGVLGDKKKAREYGHFLADNIESAGDPKTAERFRKIADGDGGTVIRTSVPAPPAPSENIYENCHHGILMGKPCARCHPPAPSEPSDTAMNRAWLAHNDLVRGLGTQEDFEAGYRSGWRDRGGK